MASSKQDESVDGRSGVATKQDDKVDVEELLAFIFPKSLQHPLSTGRLYAFGMYGPLDSNAQLRAGHHGQRVVSPWEIDTMCLQFEKEDILQVLPTKVRSSALSKERFTHFENESTEGVHCNCSHSSTPAAFRV